MAEKEEAVVVENSTAEVDNNNNNMKDRKTSWAKLRRVDSLNLEAGRVSMTTSHNHPSGVLNKRF